MLRRTVIAILLAAALLIALPVLAARGFFGRGIRNWAAIQINAIRFNWIYAGHGSSFRERPNDFLVIALEGRPPGAALDVAMGQGRNGLYLAEKGWQVTGFDIAGQGLDVARKAAAARGLSLRTVRATVDGFRYGTSEWDLIVLLYAPFDFNDALLVERIRTGLKPGGLVLVETPLDSRLAAGQLRRAFDGFEIIHYGEDSGAGDWFPQPAVLARLLARKPL